MSGMAEYAETRRRAAFRSQKVFRTPALLLTVFLACERLRNRFP